MVEKSGNRGEVMALTKAQKLQAKIGKRTVCDFCHKAKPLNENWMMTPKRQIVCPDCQKRVLAMGIGMVSI